jgi:hypothetical protein
MKEAKLGQLIDATAQRDAIHIAIVPLIAGETLYRGDKFRLKFNTHNVALRGDYNTKEALGIVDPFLEDNSIDEGDRFYGVLFPGTVTGMRHQWQHPAFEENKPIKLNEHEEWLRDFADRWNFDYEHLIEVGTTPGEWRYITARGIDLHNRGDLGEDHDLFWFHLEGMTGKKFDDAHKDEMGWSCSC